VVRLSQSLNARWDQFDLDGAIWIKPAATCSMIPFAQG
jgi:hypothetical protein